MFETQDEYQAALAAAQDKEAFVQQYGDGSNYATVETPEQAAMPIEPVGETLGFDAPVKPKMTQEQIDIQHKARLDEEKHIFEATLARTKQQKAEERMIKDENGEVLIDPGTGQPLQRELTNLESMGNSLDGMVLQLREAVPNLEISSGVIARKIFGDEAVDDFVESGDGSAWDDFMRQGLSDEDITAAEREKEILGAQRGETKGVIDSVKEGDVGGVIAGTVNAFTSLGSSAILSAGTGGAGLFTDFFGRSYTDYNKAKAERENTTVEQLRADDEDSFWVPAVFAGLMGASEKFGLGKIDDAAREMIGKPLAKKAASMFIAGTSEGSTEIIQTMLEKSQQKHAETDDAGAAGVEFFKALGEQETWEAGIQGFLGGAGMSGSRGTSGKDLQKAASLLRDPGTGKKIEDKVGKIADLKQKASQTKDKQVKDLLNGQIDTIKKSIREDVREGNRVVQRLNDDQVGKLDKHYDKLSTIKAENEALNEKVASGEIDTDTYLDAFDALEAQRTSVEEEVSKIKAQAIEQPISHEPDGSKGKRYETVKNTELSNNTKTIYEKEGKAGVNNAIQANRGIIRAIANRKWNQGLASKEQAYTKKDFEHGLMDEYRKLYEAYDPAKNDNISAYINKYMPLRANRLISKNTQGFADSVEDTIERGGQFGGGELDSTTESQTDDITIEFGKTKQTADRLGLGGEAISSLEQATKKVFSGKLPDPSSRQFDSVVKKELKDATSQIIHDQIGNGKKMDQFVADNWSEIVKALPKKFIEQGREHWPEGGPQIQAEVENWVLGNKKKRKERKRVLAEYLGEHIAGNMAQDLLAKDTELGKRFEAVQGLNKEVEKGGVDRAISAVDRAIDALSKYTKGDNLHIGGIEAPLNVMIGGLRATKLALQGGKAVAAALDAGYNKVKDHISEAEWAKWVRDQFNQNTVDRSKLQDNFLSSEMERDGDAQMWKSIVGKNPNTVLTFREDQTSKSRNINLSDEEYRAKRDSQHDDARKFFEKDLDAYLKHFPPGFWDNLVAWTPKGEFDWKKSAISEDTWREFKERSQKKDDGLTWASSDHFSAVSTKKTPEAYKKWGAKQENKDHIKNNQEVMFSFADAIQDLAKDGVDKVTLAQLARSFNNTTGPPSIVRRAAGLQGYSNEIGDNRVPEHNPPAASMMLDLFSRAIDGEITEDWKQAVRDKYGYYLIPKSYDPKGKFVSAPTKGFNILTDNPIVRYVVAPESDITKILDMDGTPIAEKYGISAKAIAAAENNKDLAENIKQALIAEVGTKEYQEGIIEAINNIAGDTDSSLLRDAKGRFLPGHNRSGKRKMKRKGEPKTTKAEVEKVIAREAKRPAKRSAKRKMKRVTPKAKPRVKAIEAKTQAIERKFNELYEKGQHYIKPKYAKDLFFQDINSIPNIEIEVAWSRMIEDELLSGGDEFAVYFSQRDLDNNDKVWALKDGELDIDVVSFEDYNDFKDFMNTYIGDNIPIWGGGYGSKIGYNIDWDGTGNPQIFQEYNQSTTDTMELMMLDTYQEVATPILKKAAKAWREFERIAEIENASEEENNKYSEVVKEIEDIVEEAHEAVKSAIADPTYGENWWEGRNELAKFSYENLQKKEAEDNYYAEVAKDEEREQYVKDSREIDNAKINLIDTFRTLWPQAKIVSNFEEALNLTMKALNKTRAEAIDYIRSTNGFAVNAGPGGIGDWIYISEDNTNGKIFDTSVHELGHIWSKALATSNPKLWKQGVAMITQSSAFLPAWKKVINYGFEGDWRLLRDAIDKGDGAAVADLALKDPQVFEIMDEMLATAIGQRGEGFFNAQNPALEGQWHTFIENIVNWLKNLLGIDAKPESADEFLDLAVKDILQGSRGESVLADHYRQLASDPLRNQALELLREWGGGRIKESKRDDNTPESLFGEGTIKQSKRDQEKRLSAFDFDDTLFRTHSKIIVKGPNGETKLNAEEFAKGYKLKKGESFDFSDFDKVVKPEALEGIDKLRDAIAQGDDVVVLTARGPQAGGPILQLLESYLGKDAKKVKFKGVKHSSPDAKVNYIKNSIAKYGYNKVFFTDDAIKNTEAMQEALSKLPIESRVEVAKAIGLEEEVIARTMQDIIAEKTGGIKTPSKFAAEQAGRKVDKKKWRFFLPPSAEDFQGLLYALLPKGKKGDQAKEFFDTYLHKPFARAEADLIKTKNRVTQAIGDLNAKYAKAFKMDKEFMESNIPGDNKFTMQDAIRAYLLTDKFETPLKQGEIPAKSLERMKAIMKSDPNMVAYAESFEGILGAFPTSTEWEGGNLKTDVLYHLNHGLRKQALSNWQANIDAIFSKENMRAMEAQLGKSWATEMQKTLVRMKRGSNRTPSGNKTLDNFTDWLNGSVGVVMFWNLRSAALQTISALNFIGAPGNNVFKAAKAFANQPQFWSDFKMLMNDDYLLDRRNNSKFDVATAEIVAEESYDSKIKKLYKATMRAGFKPTQLVDSFAIALGGASWYRNRLEQMMKQNPEMTEKQAHEETMVEFQMISEESQQSARTNRISNLQASALGRTLFAFGNTPLQYARLTKRAVQDLTAGRGNIENNVARIAWYGGLQGVLFATLQNGILAALMGDDDEEEESRSSKKKRDEMLNKNIDFAAKSFVDSWLRGWGLPGAVAATARGVYSEAKKQIASGKLNAERIAAQGLNISPVLSSKFRDLAKAFRPWGWKQELAKINNLPWWHKENPMIGSYATGVGAVTNLPTDNIVGLVNQVRTAADNTDSALNSIMLAMGWNERQLGITEDREDKRALRIDMRNGKAENREENREERRERMNDAREDRKRKRRIRKGTATFWDHAKELSPFNRLNRGEDGQAHKDGTIEVDPNLPPAEKAKTIAHEKHHVKQMREDGLDYDDHSISFRGKKYARKNGQIEFNGKMLKEGDPSLPWEAEAYGAEPDSPLKRTDKKPKPGTPEWEATVQAGKDFNKDWYSNPVAAEKFKEQAPRFKGGASDRFGTIDDTHFREGNASGAEAEYWRNNYADEEAGEHKHNVEINPNTHLTEGLVAHESSHAAGYDYDLGKVTKGILGDGARKDQWGRYINSPDEQYANLQQIRQELGLRPDQRDLTPEQLMELAEKKGSDDTKAYIKNFGADKVSKAHNTVAENKPKKKRSLKDLYSNKFNTTRNA